MQQFPHTVKQIIKRYKNIKPKVLIISPVIIPQLNHDMCRELFLEAS